MNYSDLVVKYLPLIVAVISAIIAYSFGRVNENKKKLITMLDESLNIHYSVIYQELIRIYCLSDKRDKIEEAKEYIYYLVEEKEIYNLYQEEINFFVLDFYIKIKGNNLDENQIINQFEVFSSLIEEEYWKRIRTQTKDLKWYINQNTMNKSLAFSLNILLRLKSTFDYLFALAIFVLIVMIYDRILAYSKTNIFSGDIQYFFVLLSLFILMLYGGIYAIYSTFERKINYKVKRFFNK